MSYDRAQSKFQQTQENQIICIYLSTWYKTRTQQQKQSVHILMKTEHTPLDDGLFSFVVNLTQAWFTWEEGTSTEKMLPSDCPWLLTDGGGQFIADDVTRGQAVLDYINKQADQAIESKLESSIPS